MNYAWTWQDAPAEARRSRVGMPSKASRGKAVASRGERQRLGLPEPTRPARDPMLEAIADSLTANDCKMLTASGTVCTSTLSNWQTGKTRTPRIDTLRRVAGALGKIIVLMDETK